MRCGSIVRINDDNEYNGFYGIVKYIIENVAFIFCVQRPEHLYVATENNNVITIEE